MSGKIFINYRRGDEPGFTGRLFDRLETAFPDSIAPGLDFVRVLEDHVGRCDILLAVIGPNWLAARDEAGNKRLDNPNDFVRIEIESALKLGKRIVPVLVNNAAMPQAHQLPESLKPLSRRNAVRLSHERFKADTQGLVSQLEKAVEDARAALQRADDEAAREAELADTVQAYEAFLKERPQSRHAARARNRLRALRAKANPLTGSFAVWMAGAFALLSPIILFASYTLFQDGLLLKPMEDLGLFLGGVEPNAEGSISLGVIYVSLIISSIGLVMMLRVGSEQLGLAASLYWLGCVFAVLGILTVLIGLKFPPNLETGGPFLEGKIGPGNVVVALLIAASAVALAKWRREVVSELEIAIYWLGSALALVYAVSIYGYNELPENTHWLANFAAALIGIGALFFLLNARAAFNWGEVGVYWVGLAVLVAQALSNLSIYFSMPLFGGIGAYVLGILVATALIALPFARGGRRRERA